MGQMLAVLGLFAAGNGMILSTAQLTAGQDISAGTSRSLGARPCTCTDGTHSMPTIDIHISIGTHQHPDPTDGTSDGHVVRSEPYHTQSSHPLAKRANQIRMGNPDKSRPYPSIFTDEFATTTASTSSPTESVYFVTTSPCVTVPFIPAASDPVYRDSGNSRTSSKGGFSAGQIAGIIGGSILGGLALTSLGLWLCCLGPLTKAKRNKDEKADSTAAQPSTTPPLSDANQGERITIRTTGDPAQGETVYRTVDPSSASTAQQQPVDGGRSRNSVTPGTTTEAFPAMSGRNGMERAGGGDGAGQGAAGGQAGQGRGQGQGVSGSPVYYTRSPLAGQQVAQGPSIQEVPQNGRRVQARHDGAASEPVSESPEWWDAGLFV